MGYRANMQGDYRSGYQGGFGLVSLGMGLGKSLFGRLARKFGGATAASVAVGSVLGRATGAVGRPVLPVPLPGGARLDVASLLPGGRPAFIPGPASPDMIPKGYRLNKSSYFLKSGQFVPEGTKLVRIRRRNFANGRALRRSIGRVKGFERLVKGSRKSLRALAKI